MKTLFIKKLYDDANVKVETMQKYIKIFENKLVDAININYDFIKKYEELFTIYQKTFQNTKLATPNEFAIEKGAAKEEIPQQEISANNQQVSNGSNNGNQTNQDYSLLQYNIKAPQIIKDLEITAPLVEYNFETLQKNLQYLQTALQNYQAIIAQIENAWKSLLNM